MTRLELKLETNWRFREERIAKGEKRKGNNGEDIQYCQGEQEVQISGPAAQSLSYLRTSARLSAQVRDLPPVLPWAGSARRDSRGHEVELVGQWPGVGGEWLGSPSRLVLSQALMKRWREQFVRKLTSDDLRRYKA